MAGQDYYNEEVRRRFGVENLEHRLSKMRLRWFGHMHVKRRDGNSILRRVMELEVKGTRRPVGRPKKTWTKVVEEYTRMLFNIPEDMAEDRK